MNITISGRHFDITQAIRSYAEEKANKLTKYYDLIQEIQVILDSTSDKTMRVEMIVNAEHNNTFVATVDGTDLYGCIDQVTHKLERQITDHKERFRNRKHSAQ